MLTTCPLLFLFHLVNYFFLESPLNWQNEKQELNTDLIRGITEVAFYGKFCHNEPKSVLYSDKAALYHPSM